MTEAKLELYAGWVHGSDMVRRYAHFSVRHLEEAILEVHGLKSSKGCGNNKANGMSKMRKKELTRRRQV
ncbi:hypothetical protein KEJ34_01645 [Candidatus Bathyarchaeota archaeon]|nr:hypothetical protein [Candidatus Bathyarchaeota archaeon]